MISIIYIASCLFCCTRVVLYWKFNQRENVFGIFLKIYYRINQLTRTFTEKGCFCQRWRSIGVRQQNYEACVSQRQTIVIAMGGGGGVL